MSKTITKPATNPNKKASGATPAYKAGNGKSSAGQRVAKRDDGAKASNAAKDKPKDAVARLTKKARLIQMLQGKEGVTIADASVALDWQQHTTRAALTGLRKAGHVLSASKPESGGAGRYRVTGKTGDLT